MAGRNRDDPIYLISVVARMLDVHPQTLRMYEREGLISPKRSNRQRLYSDEDVERLSMILRLSRELGVNRSGVDIILRLRHRLECLQAEVEEIMQSLDSDMRESFEQKIKSIFRDDEEEEQ